MKRNYASVVPGAVERGIPRPLVSILLALGADDTDLKLDATITDLAFDEMDIAELAMTCEHVFHLDPFPDRVLDTFPDITLAALIDLLRVLGAKL